MPGGDLRGARGLSCGAAEVLVLWPTGDDMVVVV